MLRHLFLSVCAVLADRWPRRPRARRVYREPYRARRRAGRGVAWAVVAAATLALLCCGTLGLGALWLQRAADRSIALAFPTPTRTPDITALGAGPVMGPPSLQPEQIRAILASYDSPAVDDARAFYDLGVRYGIDPAYGLAFFVVESRAGTRGVARTTHNIGNIRARPGEPAYQGYRLYASWHEGIEDWYRLIADTYVKEWRLTTVDTILPVYAPHWDNNDPGAYAHSVKMLVAGWRGL
ncbi:MAG TPA: glucosaminidase domain-containing protein [Thermomicrobiales bacterium]|nr:glucosaminidase domain-containing protein [Thermomicrobiales bacterium]